VSLTFSAALHRVDAVEGILARGLNRVALTSRNDLPVLVQLQSICAEPCHPAGRTDVRHLEIAVRVLLQQPLMDLQKGLEVGRRWLLPAVQVHVVDDMAQATVISAIVAWR